MNGFKEVNNLCQDTIEFILEAPEAVNILELQIDSPYSISVVLNTIKYSSAN